MNKKWYVSSLLIFGLLGSIVHAEDRMKPVIRDGKYYSSEFDNNEFVTWNKITGWVRKWIHKLFTPGTQNKSSELMDITNRLHPTQIVPPADSIEPRITWIGHASFLIQINGFNIITDPIFGHINALNDPLFMMGTTPIVRLPGIPVTKRAVAPGIKLEDLPPLDMIIISHDHSDHLDADALIKCAKNEHTTICVPQGKKPLMKKFGFTNEQIVEKSWWEDAEITKEGKILTVTCLPALHYSIRFSPLSYRKSLWASWMIRTNDTTIYFAGDTAYGPHFAQIAEEFPSIDFALMPIGPTHEGKNKHSDRHTDVAEAIDAFIDLQAQRLVPMHYGTFALGNSHLYYPIERLPQIWQAREGSLEGKELLWLGQGHTATL